MVATSQLHPGTYRFQGAERCDNGYKYDSQDVVLILQENFKLYGTFSLSSCQEDSQICHLFGTWNKVGQLEFKIVYYSQVFKYVGWLRKNVVAGKFWRSKDMNSSFSCASSEQRGIFRYVQVNTNDNENYLAKFCVNYNWAPVIPVENENLWEQIDCAVPVGNEISAGSYKLAGCEAYEEGDEYTDCNINITLYSNGSVTGTLVYDTTEGIERSSLTGYWERNGKIHYNTSFGDSDLMYNYSGVMAGDSFRGKFWERDGDTSSYNSQHPACKGTFDYSVKCV